MDIDTFFQDYNDEVALNEAMSQRIKQSFVWSKDEDHIQVLRKENVIEYVIS